MEKSKKCLNCGEDIYPDYSSGGYWFHKGNRWKDDNGYRCYIDEFNLTANPRSIEKQKLIDKGFTTLYTRDKVWYRLNPLTKEEIKDPFLNK